MKLYFDSFGVEHVHEKITEFIGNKIMRANIFWIQENDSIMCGYFSIEFIDFLLAGKKFTDYTSLFPSHDFKRNNDIKYQWK